MPRPSIHHRLPERIRMWSPWWLRHVLAVERDGHERTMAELRTLEAETVPRETALIALEEGEMNNDPHGWDWRKRAEERLGEVESR